MNVDVAKAIGWTLCGRCKNHWNLPDEWGSERSVDVGYTVDDLLAWMRPLGEVWFGCHSESPLTKSPVELCVIVPGQYTHRPRGETLLEALERAVLAVGGAVR